MRKIREGVNDDIYKYYISRYTRYTVGKHTYGYMQFSGRYSKLKSIGAFSSIGADVKIVGMSHPHQYVTTSPVLYAKKFGLRKDDLDLLDFENPEWDIHIGNDIYLGQNVMILPGVKIGDGAIVGAGSLVSKDVPNYAIAAGVPARVIRYRFTPEIIASLEKIRWWEWEDEKIISNMDLMLNASEFVRVFDKDDI
jgi:virginiamycin A acetyltransferase